MSSQQHHAADDYAIPVRTLDSQNLEFRCPLDNGRHDLGVVSQDLGNLALPVELMGMILKHLDIPSLTTFRRVSKQAMLMVDSTLEYKQIMKRAPQIIRGALTLEARSFTLNDAYITLNDEACTSCGRRGSFISLITCDRVCLPCLDREKRWKPLQFTAMGEEYIYFSEMPLAYSDHRNIPFDMAKIPSVMTRPGRYGLPTLDFGPGRTVGPGQLLWASRRSCERFYDLKHCQVKIGSSDPSYSSLARRYAGQYFVSVKVPLANGERHDIAERNFCTRQVQRSEPLGFGMGYLMFRNISLWGITPGGI